MSARGGWYAMQAKANPDLFRVIYDFNRRPQHWVHPSIIETLPHASVVKALATTNHGAPHVATWLLRELKLDQDEACWDFEQPRCRIALLGSGTLYRLACYAGAASCWPGVAATIGREQLREVKGALGGEAHVFALRRGRMVVPENDTVPATGTTSLAAHALEAGWQMVATAAHDARPAVERRFALKLPADVAQAIAGKVPTAPDACEKAWQRLRKITPEVLTEGELKCFS